MSPLTVLFGFILLFASYLASSGNLPRRHLATHGGDEARLAPWFQSPQFPNKDIFIEMKFYVERRLLHTYPTSQTGNTEVFIKELLTIITKAQRSLRKIGVNIVILDIVFLDARADDWSETPHTWHFSFQDHLRKSIGENTNVRDTFDSVMLFTASSVGAKWRRQNGWMCDGLSNMIVSLMRDATTPVSRDKAAWLIASAIGSHLLIRRRHKLSTLHNDA